jgi:hypothetical protein
MAMAALFLLAAAVLHTTGGTVVGVVDLRGGGGECGAALRALCPQYQQQPRPSPIERLCLVCAGSHQAQLKSATCSSEQVQALCRNGGGAMAGGRCCRRSSGCLDPEAVCDDPEHQPFCSASKENCEGKCNSMWCDGGGGGGGNRTSFVIDDKPALFNTSKQFLSFTFDVSAWGAFESYNNFSDPAFIAAARSFAPALLRIGGTGGDNLTYNMAGGADPFPLSSAAPGASRAGHEVAAATTTTSGIPPRTMTARQWDAMNAFASAAGWQIVFGLNALKGSQEGSRGGGGGDDDDGGWTWDSTNAAELIKYTVAKQFPVVGWELGAHHHRDDEDTPHRSYAAVLPTTHSDRARLDGCC